VHLIVVHCRSYLGDNNFGIMRTVTAYVMQVDTSGSFAVRQYHRFCGKVKYNVKLVEWKVPAD